MKIRTRLLLIIGMAVLILSLLYLVMAFIWQSSFAREQYLDARYQEADSTLRQVDEQLSMMNSISLSIAYSNLIKDEFRTAITDDNQSPEMLRMRRYESNKLLSEMVFSVVGPVLWVPQVYIYANEEGAFGNGLDNGYRDYRVQDRDWYEATLALNGRRYVTNPTLPEHIASLNPLENNQHYISLVRVFFDPMNLRQGFVEVMQRDNTVFSALNDRRDASAGVFQAIFRPGDGYLYKERYFTGEDALLGHYTAGDEAWVQDRESGNFLLFLESEQSDFVLVAAVPMAGLTEAYISLVRLLALASALVVALLTPVVLSLARTVSKPINQMYHTIRAVDLESVQDEEAAPVASNIVEIVELDRAFRRMRRKITESLQRILLVEKHETQARILALQAQTNPHFLYNTFATIAAMASAGMDGQIETLCEDISALLRYISSDKEALVTVEREMDITRKYIACMQARFPGLEYTVDIPEELGQKRLPKLAIQLLVENSIKFVGTQKPPWLIEITGRVDRDGFSITVSDNGPGFAGRRLAQLRDRMEEIHRTGVLPSLELEGMGLLNLFIRMDMMYGDRILFTIENKEQGGAAVTIGFRAEKEG